jgi:hypothetical protein
LKRDNIKKRRPETTLKNGAVSKSQMSRKLILEENIMKKMSYFILLVFSLLLFGCTSQSVKVIKAEFVEDIYVSSGSPIIVEGAVTSIAIGEKGIWCSFKGHDIIKISLNFNYNALDTKEKIGTDEYLSEVYKILKENAHFFNGEIEQKAVWGFWPEKATKTSASNMKLFYVIPNNTDLNKLKFQYDASQLRGDVNTYTFSNFSSMKPLKPKKQ